jgi:hypothetical protein
VNNWFGEPWPSPDRRAAVCADDRKRIPIPVGEECLWCDETIEDGDRGESMVAVAAEPNGKVMGRLRYAHAECMLRQVVGGPAHLLGKCTCQVDLGMTRREAARWTWDWVQQHGV